ncbi:DUF6328 family protein [Nocardioides caldifontis]|uniref:DUF6328 family protein n=1 Tax=Nocardioides caldifontis TaxID=2588938 RepID=UPI0011DF7C31|nr:DUF6328 family protein [Nocardioides caldifontis]
MSSDALGGTAGGTTGSEQETPKERTTRKWNEMLQELRVAQTGIQIITGFLLTIPFSDGFEELTTADEVAYLVTVCSSILSAGLIIAPVAFHRVLFGKSEKEWLIHAADATARAGLALMAVTMTGAVFLVFGRVVGHVAATIAAAVAAVVLVTLWLVVPLFGGEREEDEDDGGGDDLQRRAS